MQSQLLDFLKVLHVDILKPNLLGDFFSMISKFERIFIKFANVWPFSEAMKYKKICAIYKRNLRHFILLKSLLGNFKLG